MCANGLFMLENFLSAATAEPASTSSETSAASTLPLARAGAEVVMMLREQ